MRLFKSHARIPVTQQLIHDGNNSDFSHTTLYDYRYVTALAASISVK